MRRVIMREELQFLNRRDSRDLDIKVCPRAAYFNIARRAVVGCGVGAERRGCGPVAGGGRRAVVVPGAAGVARGVVPGCGAGRAVVGRGVGVLSWRRDHTA
jgi:hypothetical protein